ncbi:MAG: 5'/3'-nucleotidase SurE [Deltaproteobacteria bacterium]|nr:5'/3'-nucleotidase SurE [Deltaproteobacteria bacterium]
MKIVLTNDDGIDGPGLQALEECLNGCGKFIIVAPKQAQSGVGHRLTTMEPIVVEEAGFNRFAVEGTPADCARIALRSIAPDADWLIAGINPGANLGLDVYNSGTVAAAREASILGCKSISISQYIAKNHHVDWNVTGHHSSPVLRMLINRPLEKGAFWNVNLPHPLRLDSKPAFKECDLDAGSHHVGYRQENGAYVFERRFHERPRETGKDVEVCFGGKISITRMTIL